MRKKIVAGNWKMNLDLNEGTELISNLLDKNVNKNVTSIIAPPFTHLNTFKTMLSHQTSLLLHKTAISRTKELLRVKCLLKY